MSTTVISILASSNQDAHGKSHAIGDFKSPTQWGSLLFGTPHSIVKPLSVLHTSIHTQLYIVDTNTHSFVWFIWAYNTFCPS